MTGCCHVACKNSAIKLTKDGSRKIRLFKIPKNPERRKEWLPFLQRPPGETYDSVDNWRLCEVCYFLLNIFSPNFLTKKDLIKFGSIFTGPF